MQYPPTPTAPNLPPSANAGPDQSVATDTQVTLDGSRSADPECDALTFILTAAPEGPQLIFALPTPGIYRFALHVNDGHMPSPPDSVTGGPDLIFPLNGPNRMVRAA